MHRPILAAILLGTAAPAAAADETPFRPSNESFASAAACKARLASIVTAARSHDPVAVKGPYEIAPGDIRVHAVIAAGSGHRITEHRCLAEKLSSRTWRHSMDEAEAEAPETIDSMAAKAEWLKKTKKD